MANDALSMARQKLNDLLEAARKGSIIPIRLPGQIEEISELLVKAEAEAQAASASAASANTDHQDEAYFVGHAIHELRTPMTSIRGYSDMLGNPAMGQINDMQKQFLEVIRSNARRMESLLTDMSFVNKIRHQTLKPTLKMELFKNVALAVEKAMKPLAEELGRQLNIDIPQGLPLLNTDGDLLRVALCKLIENGLRYSPADGGVVTMTATAEDNTLVITIADNGIGMTPEEQAQLGTLYFRSDNDVVREYKGSGLGIPVAYGILNLLGADYHLQTAPNSGTTWTIRIQGMS